MIIALWAFIAMMLQDIIGVANSQAMARNKAHLAGATDAVGYLCVLATNHYALNALNSHSSSLKVVVVVAVTAANYLGSVSGVEIGQRWITPPIDPLIVKVADLIMRVNVLEGELSGRTNPNQEIQQGDKTRVDRGSCQATAQDRR